MKFALKIGSIATFFCLLFSLSGCVLLFAPRHQRVTMKTATPDAHIIFEDDTVGKNKAKLRLSKLKVYYGVTAEKEGYKTRRYGFELHKLSPAAILAVLDVAVFAGSIIGVYGGGNSTGNSTAAEIDKRTAQAARVGFGLGGGLALSELLSAKAWKFDKVQQIPALIPFPKRDSNEKFLLINTTGVDAKKGDIRQVNHRSVRQSVAAEPGRHTKRGIGLTHEKMEIEQTIFTNGLNQTLKKMNFIDTSNTIFPNVNNSLYINAKIKRITFHVSQGRFHSSTSSPNALLSVELSIDWDILDFYKQKVHSIHTNEISDNFQLEYREKAEDLGETINDAIKDNLEYALIGIHKELKEKGMLAMTKLTGAEVAPATGSIEIPKPVFASERKINDFYRSSVTIKADGKVGSGAIISADGYIVTSYHLIAGIKQIQVVFNDTSKAVAEFVRSSAEGDIALIRVKRTGLEPFLLSEDTDPEIGGDVWAIGTPKTAELGQSISKGIISGIRKANNVTMLQTDASVNTGNVGGALVNKQGVVLGIVSSKLEGYETQGIGFAVLAYDVLAKLGLKYR